jgi:hypothetical protein
MSKIPVKEMKYFVKRNYPNVTWGALGSTVKNLTVSSNTSDRNSQLILIRRKAAERNGDVNPNGVAGEEEVIINPSTISLDLLGCPFIDRGSQIFVDTGTGTDLDNVYTVNNITHNVRSSGYTTNLKLLITNQGEVSGVRKKLSDKVKTIVASKSSKLSPIK